MTDRYQGEADLVDSDGDVIDTVEVALRYFSPGEGEPGTWDGYIAGPDRGGDWMEATKLRMPDGTESGIAVNVIAESREGASLREARIRGLGERPF